jgi:hypothetical protein
MAGITYTLLVDLLPAPPAVVDAVESIETEARLGMAGILRLRLGVARSEDGDRWLPADDALFRRLTRISLLISLDAGMPVVVFDGHVVETDLALSDDPGASSFEVVALDSTVLMNLEEKVHTWPNMPDSIIAVALFGQYGIIADVDATQPVRTELETTVTQRDTDIRFLRHLAHRNGFDLYVTPGPAPGVVFGHFHAPRVDLPPQGVLSVGMGEATNVSSFRVRHEMVRPSQAEASGVDARTVADQPAQAGAASLTLLGSRPVLNGDQPRRTLLRTAGLNETGELKTFAQAAVDRSAWAVTVDGELETAVYGDVLRIGSPVLVRGAGPTFSGSYYVERVLHHLEGEEHAQRFTLHRNALEPTGTENYMRDTGLPG